MHCSCLHFSYLFCGFMLQATLRPAGIERYTHFINRNHNMNQPSNLGERDKAQGGGKGALHHLSTLTTKPGLRHAPWLAAERPLCQATIIKQFTVHQLTVWPSGGYNHQLRILIIAQSCIGSYLEETHTTAAFRNILHNTQRDSFEKHR